MRKSQSILEYVMLVTIAATAVTAMYTYIQRSVHAHLNVIEEQVNSPEEIKG
ncbi:MAG: hypothetical protein ABH858_02520 [Candidatus Omnitrophota bacterium]